MSHEVSSSVMTDNGDDLVDVMYRMSIVVDTGRRIFFCFLCLLESAHAYEGRFLCTKKAESVGENKT